MRQVNVNADIDDDVYRGGDELSENHPSDQRLRKRVVWAA